MQEVVVSRLGLDGATQSYVVVLQEADGDRVLPIWIGQTEAESIVMQIHGIRRPRPLTHDLCKSVIVGMGGTLRRVQITRVEKNTYYAELHIERDGQVVAVDARPSDSIAIALRFDAPIFADESLLATMEVEEAGEDEEADDGPDFGASSEPDDEPGEEEAEDAGEAERAPDAELTPDQLKQYLEKLRPEDFGKFNL